MRLHSKAVNTDTVDRVKLYLDSQVLAGAPEPYFSRLRKTTLTIRFRTGAQLSDRIYTFEKNIETSLQGRFRTVHVGVMVQLELEVNLRSLWLQVAATTEGPRSGPRSRFSFTVSFSRDRG